MVLHEELLDELEGGHGDGVEVSGRVLGFEFGFVGLEVVAVVELSKRS